MRLSSRLVLLSFCLFSLSVMGKDLKGRFGFGATGFGPGLAPAFSIDWQNSEASNLELNLGLDTRETSDTLELGLRFVRLLFIEDHNNFGLFGGGGLGTRRDATASSTGFFFDAGVQSKFFLQGLPNMGLSAGAGIRLDTGGAISFRTIGFGGFHYYF